MMKRILVLSISYLIVGSLLAQTKTALFLGNSYTGVNNLPSLIENMALSFGDTLVTDRNTPGGHQLIQHSTNATSLAKIKAQNWDFVVLQEQSQKPSFPPAQVQQDVYPYAEILNDSIKANYSCTETVFYMTWGRKNGDASNCTSYPPLCTYDGMQQRLRESYMEMANDNNATVSPVGVAWKNLRDSFPTIELYSLDESHPSIHGSYLAACVFYCTMFQKSCIGSTYIPSGIGTGDAVTIQTVATNTVLDSMDLWRINANHPIANFNYSGGGTVNFTNTSTNDVYYHWDFGDGNTSVLENPNNAYGSNGNYNVELIVYSQDSCFSDTIIQTVNVTSVGIDEMDLVNGIKTYPNPTKDVVNIISEQPFTNIEVYDAYGRLMIEQKETRIDLTKYSKGVYFIRIKNLEEVFGNYRLIKN